jgi:hypothetical protein
VTQIREVTAKEVAKQSRRNSFLPVKRVLTVVLDDAGDREAGDRNTVFHQDVVEGVAPIRIVGE